MYHFYFYVPQKYAESVKKAVFEAGAGIIGDYHHCSWQTDGIGQYMPGTDSNPFLGEREKLHTEPEVKIEMVCRKAYKKSVCAALLQAHPYEEVAYGFIKINV